MSRMKEITLGLIRSCAISLTQCTGCSDLNESISPDFFGGRKPYRIDVAPSDSLISVRDRIRSLPSAQKGNGVEVRLAPGRYVLSEPLSLQDVDSGRPGAPIVWRGAPGTPPAAPFFLRSNQFLMIKSGAGKQKPEG